MRVVPLVFLLTALSSLMAPSLPAKEGSLVSTRKVCILPIREDIMPPLVYLVRRGVKEAMEAKADVLILDMDTNGGRVDVTEEIISILNQFKGQTITYVNRRAFSAGAFIATATQQIYMAPQSVIGAAAPLMMGPGGSATEMPQTMEAKATSGIRALVRANAQKNGYNVEVVEAMIDKNKELVIDGEVLNSKGQILTLTNTEAERKHGDSKKPLLSSGTVESLDDLVTRLGYSSAQRLDLRPTGVETFATWINTISPLLLIIGVIGIYIELKTPGFGLPGIVGLAAFAIYFLGGYVAGLSGMEWLAVFILGLILFALELFVFPGTLFLGFLGAGLVVASIVLAMIDIYPGVPDLPLASRFRVPLDVILRNLSLTLAGSLAGVWALAHWLPKTSLYGKMISHSVSGEVSVRNQEEQQARRLGEMGVTLSVLRPGGKARFSDQTVDVISQGEMIPKGSPVRIIAFTGREAVVEAAG